MISKERILNLYITENLTIPKVGETCNLSINQVRHLLKKYNITKDRKASAPRSDLVGKRFGKLTVIEDDGTRTTSKSIKWLCRCDCGNETHKGTYFLKNGLHLSCGCDGMPSKEEHWNWKGGITSDNELLRHSPEYKKVRMEVMYRDQFTCQCCGATKCDFNVHHLEPWATVPEKRFVASNLILVCSKCHTKFHKEWGKHNNTPMQFFAFVQNSQFML